MSLCETVNSGGVSGHFCETGKKVTIILRTFLHSEVEPCYNEGFRVFSGPNCQEFRFISGGYELWEGLFLRNLQKEALLTTR